MTLIGSLQPKKYRWKEGDLISAVEACRLLGYKSKSVLQDPERRMRLHQHFKKLGLPLTLEIYVGCQQRFIRKEIDNYLTRVVEMAQRPSEEHEELSELRLVA